MALLSPIYLFALAAIGIPVVIHLWNIRPGQTLKVGSISLFKESSPKSSRSFKLMDLLLLALRCLLLALIAFLLAGPMWQRELTGGNTKGWVLIPEGYLSETYSTYKPQVDSLIKQGYEFHYFGGDFKKADLNEVLKANNQQPKDALNYWTLIRQLQPKVPGGTTVYLFTPNSPGHFEGSKPTIGLKINWQTFTPADSLSNWPAAAWMTPQGDIRVMQGMSTTTGISYHYVDIKSYVGSSDYKVDIQNGIPVITTVKEPLRKVTVDTATRRLAIFADKNLVDANYLRSALQAVAHLTGQRTDIVIYDAPRSIPSKQDWLFWLSDKPIDTGHWKHTNIFKYEGNKVIINDSWLIYGKGDTKTALYQQINGKVNGETLWADGYGNAILSLESGATNIYRFYSRFNPQWNGLVWSDEFPKWIMQLTNNLHVNAATYERRALTNEQIKPNFIKTNEYTDVPNAENEPLDNYLWMVLLIVFITERWLATHNNRILANG